MSVSIVFCFLLVLTVRVGEVISIAYCQRELFLLLARAIVRKVVSVFIVFCFLLVLTVRVGEVISVTHCQRALFLSLARVIVRKVMSVRTAFCFTWWGYRGSCF